MLHETSKNRLSSAAVVAIGENNAEQTLLLETGYHDDALRYFAKFSLSSQGSYLIYLAKSSLLLDLVRFNRSAEVIVSFSAGLSFVGSLSLCEISAPSLSDSTLVLNIISAAPSKEQREECFCPLT